jgi:signal transduction histidine kinase
MQDGRSFRVRTTKVVWPASQRRMQDLIAGQSTTASFSGVVLCEVMVARMLTVKSQLGENGQIEISVNDTGPGLPAGKVDQIFEAFFTTKLQGSGMGLAICKSIVESQGGRIWANGDGGRGATFHFTLPAAPAETNPPVDAA